MYCQKCGEKILEGASFCAKCGTKLKNIPKENVNEKLKMAKKVSNCNCPKCGYSGNMKFVRYKWNPIKRWALLVVIALIGDALLAHRVNSIILAILGIVFYWIWDTIGTMPKYLQCPNCGADVYVVDVEKVRDNPTYIKPHDIGNAAHTNKGIPDNVWKYLGIALVLILLLCVIFIQSLISDKKESSKDYTENIIESEEDYISQIEEQEEATSIQSTEVTSPENVDIDEETSADVYTDEMHIACVNVHSTLMNYLNGNTSIQFSIDDLRIISENFSIIEKQNLYEAPLNVEEYVAIRDGSTIRFDYEDYVSIFWAVDTDEVIVGFMPEE